MLSNQLSVAPPGSHRDDATINESDQRRSTDGGSYSTGHEKPSGPQRESPQGGHDTDGHQQPSDPQGGRTFVSKLWGPVGIVILGQLSLQAAAWGFFGAIWLRGLISVPSFGLFLVDSFQLIDWVCTLASTVLTGCSSFLFSWAIHQSITLHLRKEGMSFATFFRSVQIASRLHIWEPKHLSWTVLSIAVAALATSQTSGWSVLLRPTVSYHKTHITGSELDLSSSLLRPMLSSGALDFSDLVALSVGQTGSGYAAALYGEKSLPTSLTLLDKAFNTATGGILPLAFYDLDASPWFGNKTVLPKVLSAPSVGFHNGLAWTSSINQQGEHLDNSTSRQRLMCEEGFTADVSCEMRDLKPDTTPSLTIDITNGTESSPASVRIASNCVAPGGTQFNVTSADTNIGENQGYLLMIACDPGVAAESYTLIFVGSGLYDFMRTTMCTLTPKITNVQADYSYDLFSDTIQATTHPGGIPDIEGPAAISAVTTIYNMLSFSQAVNTNIVGDQLTAVLTNLGFDQTHTMFAMNEYIRGVVEYSGTVFRACLSAKNGTFLDGVPNNMTLPIQGTLHTQFFGWQFNPSTSWVLIPGAIISLGSIWFLLRTVARHAGDPEGKPFNPADTMHLVAASAAGGLKGVIHGTDKDAIIEAKNAHIVIGAFKDQEPAFIRVPSKSL
ncbi:hypothetical protein C8J57DRAFT_1593600 [Mycena rebaudengoi]|nr:hypothetical protein C8J57DRAFT_1593600 [Mycena rebaudengoi]